MKHTFNEFKKVCKSADDKRLLEMLKEKESELFKTNFKKMKASQRVMYTAEDKGMVPIKVLHKQVAIIKTYINQRRISDGTQKPEH